MQRKESQLKPQIKLTEQYRKLVPATWTVGYAYRKTIVCNDDDDGK